MASKPRLPPKKDVVLALLEDADVYVHLDPRRDQVRVPQWFKKQPQLVLQIGLNMPVPITDLEVTDDAVSCTLSFNRSPFFCFIPWPAVYALVGADGRAMVWPEDIPAEVAAQAAKQVQQAQQAQPAAKRSKLRAVKPGDSAAAPDAPDASAAAAAPADAPKSDGEAAPALAEAATEPGAGVVTPAPIAAVEPLAPAEPATEPGTGAPRASEPPPAKGKGKRELPPYLRVVK